MPWIPDPGIRFQLLLVGKFLLVGSGILGFGIQNTAKGFRNTNNDWVRNPNSTDPVPEIRVEFPGGGGGGGDTPLW